MDSSSLSTRTPARIVSLRPLASDLNVVLVEAEAAFPFRSGQHVPVIFPANEEQPYFYSIASAPDELGERRFELLVGKPRSGPLPPFVAGASVKLLPSGGERILDLVSAERPIHLVGMGTGISPLRAIERESRRITPARKVVLLAGARSASVLPFHDEFLARRSNSFRYVPVFSREEREGELLGRVSDHLGEVTVDDAFFVVCGSVPMVSETRARLVALGIRSQDIHGEGYGE